MGHFNLTEMLWFRILLDTFFFPGFTKNVVPQVLFLLMFSSFLQEHKNNWWVWEHKPCG